jgi:metal-dependent amidase/aminoacylase/carboxypeptidase family protein
LDWKPTKFSINLLKSEEIFMKTLNWQVMKSALKKVLEKYLLDLGLEVQKDLYGHSLIGILKGGKKGKKIAWRADMDALPGNNTDKVSLNLKIKVYGMAVAMTCIWQLVLV